MTELLPLLMLGAMYENGGNTTHRFLDGHPEMAVYPYESQLGTRLVNDELSSMFPAKYRWPVFALHASAREDYHAIIDEETKVRSRTPHVSKFRHAPFDMSDEERRDRYVAIVEEHGRDRATNVSAFFAATFDAWKDRRRTGREVFHVGYSPILVVDAENILREMPNAHFVHVVRNPWSAYADTKKRPLPLPLAQYLTGWGMNQYYALIARQLFPGRFHLVRFEDVIADPRCALGEVCRKLGLEQPESLATPSWNGTPLAEVYPWGTIRHATPEANLQTARELSGQELDDIRMRADKYLDDFDYRQIASLSRG
jgi:hypothetical protein